MEKCLLGPKSNTRNSTVSVENKLENCQKVSSINF